MKKGWLWLLIIIIVIATIISFSMPFIVNKSVKDTVQGGEDSIRQQAEGLTGQSNGESGCTDSDGEDYFTKGVVNYETHEIYDRCLVDQGTVYLIENTCSNGIPDTIKLECPSPTKCLEGVCIDSPENCFDSDGGLDYYVKGKVSAVGYESSTSAGFDHCVGNELSETYCENDLPAVPPKIYTCPNGCENGACI